MSEPAKSRLIVRIEAETDITDHAVWYERKEAGLGHAFLAEVDAAIAAAVDNPFRYPRLRRRPEVRRVLTNRFPTASSSSAATTRSSSSAYSTARNMTASGARG